MQMRSITANPSQIMVEQLAALDVEYLFYNSGSREARFLTHCMLTQIYTVFWHSMRELLRHKRAVTRRRISIRR